MRLILALMSISLIFFSCVTQQHSGTGWYDNDMSYKSTNSGSNSYTSYEPSTKGYESDGSLITPSSGRTKKIDPNPTEPLSDLELIPCNKTKSNYKILIDPGHGGKDPGGRGNGIREKDIVLTVSQKLVNLLKSKGYKVYMTRDTDVYLTLQQRVALANKLNVSMMVSIHANTIPNKPHIRGTLTIYPKSSASARNTWLSKVLAESIENRFKEKKEVFHSRNIVRDYRGLYLLRKAKVPTVITEIGFMTNKDDAKLLNQAEHQERIINAIYNGIVTYLNKLN